MIKKVTNPVHEGLDSLCGGNDSAIGRIFGVSRQSVGQWRRWSSIPRHFMRTFCALTGRSVDELLEFAELMDGVNYEAFVSRAKAQLQREEDKSG